MVKLLSGDGKVMVKLMSGIVAGVIVNGCNGKW